MIKCLIKDNTIKITGHANFNEYGKDIVCASVSSIISTTVNSIMNIDKFAINYKDDGKTITIVNNKNNTLVLPKAGKYAFNAIFLIVLFIVITVIFYIKKKQYKDLW